MTNQPPCETSPDDWFIRDDGRQYVDDDLLSDQEVQAIKLSVAPLEDETPEGHLRRVDRAITAAEADRRRQALTRRRHAKEACWTCPLRLQCVDLALGNDEMHGTWGGYYQEELQEIRRATRARLRRNA